MIGQVCLQPFLNLPMNGYYVNISFYHVLILLH